MTWTTFTTELDPDQPARSVDIKAINDNVTAQANGDSGAPKQQTAGIADKAVTRDKLNDTNAESDWVIDRIHQKQVVTVSAGSKVTFYDNSAGYSTNASSAEKTDKFWVSQVDGTVSYSFDTDSGAARVSIWRNGVNIITEDGLGTFTGSFTVDFGDVVYFTLHETSASDPTVTLSNVLITADY